MESDGPPAMFGGVDSPEGVEIEVMWVITDSPPDLNKGADVEHPAWSLGAVPVGGTRWSMLTFHPGAGARYAPHADRRLRPGGQRRDLSRARWGRGAAARPRRRGRATGRNARLGESQ